MLTMQNSLCDYLMAAVPVIFRFISNNHPLHRHF